MQLVVTCNISCVVSVCQTQGDVNATCAGANQADRCVCTAANHYYLTPSSGCMFLPPPIDCKVYSLGMDEDFEQQVTECFGQKVTMQCIQAVYILKLIILVLRKKIIFVSNVTV